MSSIQSCGIYARISRDEDGSALGVARQIADCTREALRRGWPVAQQFVDNDVSASNGRARPEYVRMIHAVETGQIDAVIVWDVDRLTRTPAELETFINLADRHTLALASIGGDVDLATPQGRLTARIKGNVARHEVEQQSRRLKRKFDESAAAGKPHGPVPFGYRRITKTDEDGRGSYQQDVIYEEEAAMVRDWYRRIADGETLRSIANELNGRGKTTKAGNPWVGAVIGRMLRRPAYLGLRKHRGEVVGPGNWEAIIDEDTYDRALAILSDPRRIPPRGREPRYLGSGIYLCGKCGGVMRPVVQAKESENVRAPAYSCSTCQRTVRKMQPIDELVEMLVIERLSRPDAALDLSRDPSGLREAMAARDAIVARMDGAADEYAAGTITVRQLTRITERLKGDLARAEGRVTSQQPFTALAGMTGAGAADAWAAASMERKRAVLRELVTITILPAGPGIKFAPEQVKYEWKGAA
ncbi:recombinase family protein [Glutamicibacter arilaitensis]|uniref:recombinase family protein n=1 Tax=Glutamicibacter arilaitensis TaxID=256701 RepID=UPI003FD3A247